MFMWMWILPNNVFNDAMQEKIASQETWETTAACFDAWQVTIAYSWAAHHSGSLRASSQFPFQHLIKIQNSVISGKLHMI